MKCLCCNVGMVRRNGVFGEFFSCKQHGTISVQNGNVVATGEVYKKLRNRQTLTLSKVGNCVVDEISLELQMQKQIMGFGVQIGELDKFIEGETLELAQLNADDDEDHWLNTRPY